MHKAALRIAAMIVAVAVAAPALTSAQEAKPGRVDKGPGSLAAARKYLEGRWSLTSFEVSLPGHPVTAIKGAGTLLYDDFGNLDIQVRVDEETAEVLRMLDIPTEKGMISSKGRTAIDLQKKTLTYFLPGQAPLGAPSGPLALNRPRHWEVEGNLLTLRTKDANGATLSVARWQKVP